MPLGSQDHLGRLQIPPRHNSVHRRKIQCSIYNCDPVPLLKKRRFQSVKTTCLRKRRVTRNFLPTMNCAHECGIRQDHRHYPMFCGFVSDAIDCEGWTCLLVATGCGITGFRITGRVEYATRVPIQKSGLIGFTCIRKFSDSPNLCTIVSSSTHESDASRMAFIPDSRACEFSVLPKSVGV